MMPNDPAGHVSAAAHAADPGERVRRTAAMTEATWQDQVDALVRLSLTRTPPGSKLAES